MTPACSSIDKDNGMNSSKNGITASPNSEVKQGEVKDGTSEGNKSKGDTNTDNPNTTEQAIQVITSDEELEEYFNSISDEEIEELFRIIEGIDISEDIDPDADPGFDEIIIP
jgi:hypothetical protein